MLVFSVSAEDFDDLSKCEKYDGRNYGIITDVKDQGSTSLCWAYSSIAASEASILKMSDNKFADKMNLPLSPEQIGYATFNRGQDPLGNTTEIINPNVDWRNSSGGTKYAAALLSQWCGPVKLNSVRYDENGWEKADYKLKNAFALKGDKLASSEEARQKMKQAIVKYGAVTFSYNNVTERDYYNPKGQNGSYPHACTIIGWDDTIPAEKFGPGETKTDGGWLVKNSYNSLPYFYLSYEVECEQIYAFEYVPKDKYDYNYFYDATIEDNLSGALFSLKKAMNIFECKNENEYIEAVNVALVGQDTDCTVEIYTDIELKNNSPDLSDKKPISAKTEKLCYGGYNCIELDEPVKISKGSCFAISVALSGKESAYIALSQNTGMSYKYTGGWTKLIVAPRIKAFTKIHKQEKPYIEFLSNNQISADSNSANACIIITNQSNEQINDVKIIPYDFSAKGKCLMDLPNDWEKDENVTYKAYLWDMSTLSPLCDNAEL